MLIEMCVCHNNWVKIDKDFLYIFLLSGVKERRERERERDRDRERERERRAILKPHKTTKIKNK